MPVANTTPATLTDLLFEKVDAGLCVVAPDGSVVRANSEWLRSTGFTAEQVVGENIIDLFPETRDMVLAMHARARAGHRVEVPRHARTVNGRETWWEGSIEPVAMEGGTGLLITRREVTSLLRAPDAEAERRSSVLLRAVADSIPDPIFAKDTEGRILFANPAALQVTGKPGNQVIGKTDMEIYDDREVGATVVATDRRIMESGQGVSIEERIQTPAGYRFFLSTKAPFRDADGKVVGLVGVASDITERKRAEAVVRESEERLRALADSMPLLAWTARPDGYINWFNRRCYDYTGKTLEELEGWKWQTIHDPATLPEVLRAWNGAIETGRMLDMEFPLRGADGKFRRFLSRALPLKDDAGNVVQWFGTHTDVTELVEAREALRAANRSKDGFLAILSHELRNPLAPIRNSTYILGHTKVGSEQARRAQSVIERQTEHLTRLVDDLLDLTRITRGKIELRPKRVDLREVVWRAADDYRLLMDEAGVAFRTALPDSKLWADADSTRIAQIVGNLLHNSLKFTKRGDEVVLSIVADGDEAEIRVRDSGAGIDPTLLERVFEPFVQADQSLARTQGGLGLGLALVKGIAEVHGGSARVESAGQGQGAEFVVRLPLARMPAAHDANVAALHVANGGRRVLVVDDNRDAAESLAEIVTLLGHYAEVALDGSSAIQKARANPPDIVLCDLGLPGMSGYEVAKALRATNGKVTQLFAVSGYAQPDDVRRAIEAGFDGHVAKPCDPEKIERLLA